LKQNSGPWRGGLRAGSSAWPSTKVSSETTFRLYQTVVSVPSVVSGVPLASADWGCWPD